jgi:hypothetical protein
MHTTAPLTQARLATTTIVDPSAEMATLFQLFRLPFDTPGKDITSTQVLPESVDLQMRPALAAATILVPSADMATDFHHLPIVLVSGSLPAKYAGAFVCGNHVAPKSMLFQMLPSFTTATS